MISPSKSDLPLLLPRENAKSSGRSIDLAFDHGHRTSEKKTGSVSNAAFKGSLIILMTIVWSAYALTLSYTRTRPDGPKYLSTTVVFLAEFTKLCLASFLLFRTHRYSFISAKSEFQSEFLGKPIELVKMSVPSIAYATQNNLDFVALSNLDPGVYQVTCQLKVLTTALFMVLIMGRRYSWIRWFAIVLLFAGVALVQLDAVETDKPLSQASPGAHNHSAASSQPKQNYFVGITAVLATCLTAGFAGVYFERMLKDATSSLWIRNMQMYFCGTISAGLACMIKESSQIKDNGFFYGYDAWVWFVVGLLSVGGIIISLVIKYLDNLLKSFASAVSISVVSLASFYLFGTSLGFYFIIGSTTVCGAIFLYNYAPE